jgi:hypothetical protein
MSPATKILLVLSLLHVSLSAGTLLSSLCRVDEVYPHHHYYDLPCQHYDLDLVTNNIRRCLVLLNAIKSCMDRDCQYWLIAWLDEFGFGKDAGITMPCSFWNNKTAESLFYTKLKTAFHRSGLELMTRADLTQREVDRQLKRAREAAESLGPVTGTTYDPVSNHTYMWTRISTGWPDEVSSDIIWDTAESVCLENRMRITLSESAMEMLWTRRYGKVRPVFHWH